MTARNIIMASAGIGGSGDFITLYTNGNQSFIGADYTYKKAAVSNNAFYNCAAAYPNGYVLKWNGSPTPIVIADNSNGTGGGAFNIAANSAGKIATSLSKPNQSDVVISTYNSIPGTAFKSTGYMKGYYDSSQPPVSIEINAAGETFAAYTNSSPAFTSFYVLNPDGTVKWKIYFRENTSSQGGGALGVSCYGTHVDAAGNFYAIMAFSIDGKNRPQYVVKFNATGTAQFNKFFYGPGTYTDIQAITSDSSGNFYLAVTSGSGNTPVTVLKINSAFTSVLWVCNKQWRAGTIKNICVDAAGNVYVSGTSNVKYPTNEAYIAKINASGVYQGTYALYPKSSLNGGYSTSMYMGAAMIDPLDQSRIYVSAMPVRNSVYYGLVARLPTSFASAGDKTITINGVAVTVTYGSIIPNDLATTSPGSWGFYDNTLYQGGTWYPYPPPTSTSDALYVGAMPYVSSVNL